MTRLTSLRESSAWISSRSCVVVLAVVSLLGRSSALTVFADIFPNYHILMKILIEGPGHSRGRGMPRIFTDRELAFVDLDAYRNKGKDKYISY
jgi:hypothetical protein